MEFQEFQWNIKIDRDDPAQGRTVVENNKLYGVWLHGGHDAEQNSSCT